MRKATLTFKQSALVISTQTLPTNSPSIYIIDSDISGDMNIIIRHGARLAMKEGKAQYDQYKQKQEQQDGSSTSAGLDPKAHHSEHYSMTLLEQRSPDPWVIFAHDKFYLVNASIHFISEPSPLTSEQLFTQNAHITIWSADTVTGLRNGAKTRVWTAPPNREYSKAVWAPELHLVNGRWYIYFTAADERQEIRRFTRRIYVLGGPPGAVPPTDGPWEFLGRLAGLPDSWAIDATVFRIDGALYTAYSGKDWEAAQPQQELFIARMLNARNVDASTPPTRISAPEHPWEKRGNAVNEGPEWIESPDGGWRGLVFSASSAGSPGYCEATLQYLGGDPLDPRAWKKSQKPIMKRRPGDEPPYGTGHGNWIDLQGQLLHVFHSMPEKGSGMAYRNATVQRAWWTPDGPSFGGHVGKLTTDREKFAGDEYEHPRWRRF
jgi:GH43 family beta-xylosidase